MSDIVLLDGGMGQELTHRSASPPSPLWSARVMYQEPDLVRQVHVENIRAGARVITLNTYSVTRDRLAKAGMEAEFAALQARACDLARQAREAAGEDVAIAACLPPLKESYRHEQVDPADRTAPIYRELAERQAEVADVFLCETMASAEQALGAARGASGLGKPVWVAWTVDDHGAGRLRSGETLTAASAALDGLDIAARLANCSLPEAIEAAAPGLAALGGPWGAYANGFTGIPDEFSEGATVERLSAREDVTPEAYAPRALGWVEQGARIVGGCCEIGPAHIAALAAALEAAGHRIVGRLA